MLSTLAMMAMVLLAMVLGVVIGFMAFARALAVTARLAATGNPDAPPAPAVSSELRATTAEGAAHARVMKDAIEKGADQLVAAARERGFSLPRDKAREDAALMLNQPPLGGAQ